MHMVFDASCFSVICDEPVNLPVEGTLVDLGKFKDKRVLRLVPVPTGTFVAVTDDAHTCAIDGALVVATSVRYAVVILRKEALLKIHNTYEVYKDGERVHEITEEVMFASGLIPDAKPEAKMVDNPPEPSEVLQSLIGD